MQNLWGKNSDALSVGINIWKSFDGETLMMTIDHIKVITQMNPFSACLRCLGSKRRHQKAPIVSMRDSNRHRRREDHT